MKKFIFAVAIVVIIFASVIFLRQKLASAPTATPASPGPTIVSVKTVANSHIIEKDIDYPAIVSPESEASVNAKISGTITTLNINLGNFVNAGQLLAKIDDIGASSSFGKNDFQSSQIQTLELAEKQAKESESLAKKNYKNNKTNVTKTAWDIAKLQKESAETALSGALDSRNIVAPISGRVVQKLVSLGDSVSFGQPLVKISKTNLVKFQFYVDGEVFDNFKIGFPVEITDNNGTILPSHVSNISPTADPDTRRFLIEARLDKSVDPLIGTVVTAKVKTTIKPTADNSILLPISAITVGQNENYIFIVENGKAKKVIVNIKKITGEIAEIETTLSSDTQIIISGNKSISDGAGIKIEN